jgi:hypothetical protein
LTKLPKTYDGEKDSLFHKFAGRLNICLQKTETRSMLIPCTSINSEWSKDLHIGPESLKLLQERAGNTLEVMDTCNDFLNRTQWHSIKGKGLTNGTNWNYKASMQQRKWFLNWRGCPQNRRLSSSYPPDKGLITRTYKEFKKLNSPKKSMKREMGKWTEQSFFKGRSSNG